MQISEKRNIYFMNLVIFLTFTPPPHHHKFIIFNLYSVYCIYFVLILFFFYGGICLVYSRRNNFTNYFTVFFNEYKIIIYYIDTPVLKLT